MNTIEDVKTALKLELIHWFSIQEQYPLEPFYCYYRKGTRQADSGLIIARKCPSKDHRLVHADRVNGFRTINENFNHLLSSLRTLPVLDV